tara:strand:+ start:572 stop:754 length:183 start_codon:yes stop_codon:yes gene_type:complete
MIKFENMSRIELLDFLGYKAIKDYIILRNGNIELNVGGLRVELELDELIDVAIEKNSDLV